MLRKLAANPTEIDDDGSFELQSHLQLNLTAQQSADRIADHFSSVSQEFSPLDIDSLPSRVKELLARDIDNSQLPQIEESKVWQLMSTGRVAKSWLKG